MLWSLNNNALMLESPKTGTTTLRHHFQSDSPLKHRFDHKTVHYSYLSIARKYEEITVYLGRCPYAFDHYAFFRSPLSRFCSACAYTRHQYIKAHRKYLVNSTGSGSDMYKKATTAFNTLFDVENFDITQTTPADFLFVIKKLQVNQILDNNSNVSKDCGEKFKNGIPIGSLFPGWLFFGTQVGWFLKENTNLLDFRNYEKEFIRMCNILELSVPSSVPVLNKTDSSLELMLSKKTIQGVIDFYQADYDFFANNGIFFDDKK